MRSVPNGSPAPAVEPDLEVLRERLGAIAEPESVRVRHLEDGIVELIGKIEDRALISPLLEEASHVEGVRVVVNRLWSDEGRAEDGVNRPIDASSGRR